MKTIQWLENTTSMGVKRYQAKIEGIQVDILERNPMEHDVFIGGKYSFYYVCLPLDIVKMNIEDEIRK